MTASILIVDDDPINSWLFQRKLAKRGLPADVHDSAVGLTEIIRTQGYELVLLDVMMPDVSGLDALRAIRSEFSKTEVPVVMLSAKGESHDVIDALIAGANDYLTKPAHIDVALARIQTQLSLLHMHRDQVRIKQMEALQRLVVTYNHEINTPLSIAANYVDIIKKRNPDIDLSGIEGSLEKITRIVKKIRELGRRDTPATKVYHHPISMYELNSSPWHGTPQVDGDRIVN